MRNRYRKVSLIAGLVAMVMGLAILGYFGYNKISRELYKKHLLETSIVFEIPDLDIKAPVLEGTENKNLQYAAGHFEDTGSLGHGNYCICGHSSTIYACIFDNLHNAENGMKMYLYDTDKTGYTYTVEEIKVIDPDDTEVLQDYGDNRITVLTCTDDGKQRICVVGVYSDTQNP